MRCFAILLGAAVAISFVDVPVVEAGKSYAKAKTHGSARRRVGGYSYSASDVINTTGGKTWLGGFNVFGDSPRYSQSPGGPFDSGFFFDSAIGPHGGNSPYLQ